MGAAHLNQEQVLALIEGQLSDGDASAIDDHMDSCASCRALVAEVARGSFVRPLTGSHQEEETTIPEASKPSLYPGELLAGRFKIVRRLGRGSMGVVYEAVDQHLNVRVALKVLPPNAASSARLLKRLRQEMVLGRRITHVNVCRLYDFGSSNGVHFISMEYLEGETLQTILARGPLDEMRARSIMRQIFEALEAAHGLGVVHRDLKPANIMVSPTGRVSVMDFGLATDLAADRSEHGVAVGTPAYWSPEQARGEQATVMSDVYSFAVMACEIWGAKRPKWGEAPKLDSVPRAYRRIIRRALRTNPEERYGSIREAKLAAAAAIGWDSLRLPRFRPLSLGFAGLLLIASGLWLHERLRDEAPPFESHRVAVTLETNPRTVRVVEGNATLGVGRVELPFGSRNAPSRTLRLELDGYETRTIEVTPLDGPVLRIGLRRSP